MFPILLDGILMPVYFTHLYISLIDIMLIYKSTKICFSPSNVLITTIIQVVKQKTT